MDLHQVPVATLLNVAVEGGLLSPFCQPLLPLDLIFLGVLGVAVISYANVVEIAHNAICDLLI